MGEVPLHDVSSFRVGAEIPLQCPNLPTHCAQRFHSQRFHVGWNTTEDESRAYEVARDQIPEHTPIFCHSHFATKNERNRVGKLPLLYKALANISRDPGSNAQTLQNLPRPQTLKDKSATFLFLSRQFDPTTLNK